MKLSIHYHIFLGVFEISAVFTVANPNRWLLIVNSRSLLEPIIGAYSKSPKGARYTSQGQRPGGKYRIDLALKCLRPDAHREGGIYPPTMSNFPTSSWSPNLESGGRGEARVCVFRKALQQKVHVRLARTTVTPVTPVNENGDEKGGRPARNATLARAGEHSVAGGLESFSPRNPFSSPFSFTDPLSLAWGRFTPCHSRIPAEVICARCP